jgi:hypothetical protein
VIVGGAALKVPGGQAAALALASAYNLVRPDWHGFNVLHTAAARTGGLMLGLCPRGGMAALRRRRPSSCSCSARTKWITRLRQQLQSLCRPSRRPRRGRGRRGPAGRGL